MRNVSFVVTALAMASLTQVHAQTSTTQIYGSLSTGLNYRTNQTSGNVYDLSNSQLSSSLLGFRGNEDLGGGLTAGFRLESGISSDTGAVGGTVAGNLKFFNRQAFVGLGLASVGTVTLGRQFHAGVDRIVQSLDVYNAAGTSVHSTPLALHGVNRFVGNDSRADNAIKVRLNGPNGITAAASYAFGEDTNSKSYSVDLAQVTGSYTVGVYALRYLSPNLVAGTGARPDYRALGLGGNVQMGWIQPYVHIMHTRQAAATVTGVRTTNQIALIGVRVPIAAWVLKAAYTHDKGTNLNNVQGRDGTKTTLVTSAEFYLSKRTSIYGALMHSKFTDGYKLDTLNIAAMARDPKASSTSVYSVGVRHDF